jgi:hypothetical protein
MQKSTVYGITNFLKMHYKDTSSGLAELFCQELATSKKEKKMLEKTLLWRKDIMLASICRRFAFLGDSPCLMMCGCFCATQSPCLNQTNCQYSRRSLKD